MRKGAVSFPEEKENIKRDETQLPRLNTTCFEKGLENGDLEIVQLEQKKKRSESQRYPSPGAQSQLTRWG